jgi:hypothetical protein
MEKVGLTVEGFIQAFRERHHWECVPGTRIFNDLTRFAQARVGSKRNIEEQYSDFLYCPPLESLFTNRVNRT